ncbi:DUF1189 domain-containing protein [Clostridiaceae bacterium WCA-383-APC-5B]|uniref:DUF1189 domain-containing protein n=1 Tax=Inconstantimicrobium porci TaxID=2652291 RepID=A0A7X2MWU1_9CLOT|nr:DUF1189 domain-containing protein [Inconstantimicrobium porci]
MIIFCIYNIIIYINIYLRGISNLEKEMGFFQKFINSFYNFKAYNEFKKQSIEKAIVYILFVSLIFTTLSSISNSIKFITTSSVIRSEMETKMPDFEFKDGVLKVDSNEPLKFVDDDTLFMIDTSGNTSVESLSSYRTYFLITNDTVYFKDSSSSMQQIDLSTFSTLTLNKQTAKNIASKLLTTILIITIIFSPIIAFLGKLLNSFTVMALAGLALSAIMSKKLKYGECAKLSIYALTVPFAIKTILKVFSITIPCFTLVYYAIAILYLGFGINALTEEQNADPENKDTALLNN